MDEISKFFAELKEEICRGIYESLKDIVLNLYNGMLDVMNAEIARANSAVTQSPEDWNSDAFGFIETIADNAFIPVAGCILTCVVAWELISMIDDRNHGHNVKMEEIIVWLSKVVICVGACAYAFEIVMAFFEISSIVSDRITAATASGGNATLDTLDFADPAVYDFGCVFTMIGNILLVGACYIVTYILSIMIVCRVWLWFLELLIHAAPASIPFATFMNKEWGQVGTNFIRKMLAVCFEGFLMLIAFGLYKHVVTNITGSGVISGGDFAYAMMMSVASGGILFILLLKVGNISASIMNAH